MCTNYVLTFSNIEPILAVTNKTRVDDSHAMSDTYKYSKVWLVAAAAVATLEVIIHDLARIYVVCNNTYYCCCGSMSILCKRRCTGRVTLVILLSSTTSVQLITYIRKERFRQRDNYYVWQEKQLCNSVHMLVQLYTTVILLLLLHGKCCSCDTHDTPLKLSRRCRYLQYCYW